MISCVKCGGGIEGVPSYLEGCVSMICRSCDKPRPAPKETDNPYDRRSGPRRVPRKCTCGAKFEPESPEQKRCRPCMESPVKKEPAKDMLTAGALKIPNIPAKSRRAFVEALLSGPEEK